MSAYTKELANRLRIDGVFIWVEAADEMDRLRAEVARRTAERDDAVDALKRIATYDYRGNQSGESQIARHALIAMRKEGGGA